METTKKFARLPPLAGVPFIGFDFAEVKSRRSVVGQLRNFVKYCLREATSPAVQVILGEWGEGKTEVYQRYIRETVRDPHAAYFVSASTVAQSFSKVQAESPLASLNFLAALFYAVRYESRVDTIPPFERYMDAEKWVDVILQTHAKARGRIFVFIDEFEELILEPLALKKILSGLKELVNKQYQPVTEKGCFPGIISFFLSCTPDAYARMQREPEIAEVFGSWERRISKVYLTPVTRQEGVRFLWDLMRYAYEDIIPEPLPIKDLGVFHTLHTIGRGNLGALVKLFTTIFNSAVVDEQSLQIIDGANLLRSLASETISVYGGTAKCFESKLFGSLQERLSEQETELLALLAGERRPFSPVELMTRLSLPSADEVSYLVARVNRKVSESGKARLAIATFAPLREGCCFEDIRKALQEEIREDEIRVDNFSQHLTDFEDALTFLEIQEGRLVPRVYVPWDYRMISATFEGVTLDSAHRLARRLEKVVNPDDLRYCLSNELVFQLFPTPIPVGLEFIKDRDLRLKMWRDTTARFPQLFREEMAKAFLTLIRYVDAYDVRVESLQPRHGPVEVIEVTIKYLPENASIKCWCLAHYGDFGPEDVQRIAKDLQEAVDIHLAIAIHVGEITVQGQEELRAREMEERLLIIPLHTALAKRMLITHLCKVSHPDQINDKLFVDSVTQLYKVEMDLNRRLREWLEQGAQVGIVLRDLYKSAARSDRDLADSLKFYINRLGEPDTPENIFRANERLMSFVPFGSRSSFVPDIESPEQLVKHTEDLAKNGFVQWTPTRTVHVANTPPEKRLIRILERGGSLSKSSIENQFVNCARAKNVLWDVYVNLLQHKGVLRESKDHFRLVSQEEALKEAREVRARYQEQIASHSQADEWPAFAHVFVTKQRACRFIDIHNLVTYLEELYENINNAADRGLEEVVLQRTALLRALAEHLCNTLIPKVRGAIEEARRLRGKALEQIDSTLRDMQDIVEQYNRWLNQNASLDGIKEAETLKTKKRDLLQMLATPVTESDLREEEKSDSAFSHQHWTKQGEFFNITLKRLQKFGESLGQQTEHYRKTVERIGETLRDLERVGEDTRSRIRTINVAERCKISKAVLSRLKNLSAIRIIHPGGYAVPPQGPSLTLEKMLEDLEERRRSLERQYKDMERSLSALEELIEAETRFHDAVQNYLEKHQRLKEKADVKPFRSQVEGFDHDRVRTLEKYEELCADMEPQLDKAIMGRTLPESIGTMRSTLKDFTERMEALSVKLDQIWEGYIEQYRHFIDSTRQLLQLVQEKGVSSDVNLVEAELQGLEKWLTSYEQLPMSVFESIRDRVRNAIIELLRQTLSEAEGKVLMSLVGTLCLSETKWRELHQVVREIAQETGSSDIEAEKLVRSLIKKGFLKEGIAISL
ncbi:MAG: hypothetical protein QXP27_03950 [Candidatus Methanomethyliaceae archaeon]